MNELATDVFQEVDVEHRELEEKYEVIHAAIAAGPSALTSVCNRLTDLAVDLERHFANEEEAGYFTEIIEMAPHLSHRAELLEAEHEQLLRQLRELQRHVAASTDCAQKYELLCRIIPGFIAACRKHEHCETELIQEAWLTDIGVGD